MGGIRCVFFGFCGGYVREGERLFRNGFSSGEWGWIESRCWLEGNFVCGSCLRRRVFWILRGGRRKIVKEIG